MSDTGLFATRLEDATARAEEFDNALVLLKKAGESEELGSTLGDELKNARETIRKYLASLISSVNSGFVSTKAHIRRGSIDILRKLHSSDWDKYIEDLKFLNQQLSIPDTRFESRYYQRLERVW